MKYSNRVVILNLVSFALTQGITFICAPIFSRILGTTNYGVVSMYNTWIIIVSTVFPLQLSSTLAMARTTFPIEKQTEYQSSILALGLLSYSLFSVLCFLLGDFISGVLKMEKVMIAVMIAHSFGSFSTGFLGAKFAYEFKAGRNFLLSFLSTITATTLSLVLVFIIPDEISYWGRILGQAAVSVPLGLCVAVYMFTKGKCFFKWEYWKFALPLGIPLVFHSLSGVILNQFDRIMIRNMCSVDLVGIYSLAFGFSSVVSIIWSALNGTWVPFYYEFSRNNEIAEMKHRARNYMELYTVAASGFVLLATEVFHIYADERFWAGTEMTIVLAIGHYMVFLYSMCSNYEFFMQKTKLVAIGTVICAVINIILNYFFITFMDGYGAALATAVAHGVQFLIHFVFAKRIGQGEFPFKMRDFLPWMIFFGIAATLALALPQGWYIRWPLGAAIGIWELRRMLKRKSIF